MKPGSQSVPGRHAGITDCPSCMLNLSRLSMHWEAAKACVIAPHPQMLSQQLQSACDPRLSEASSCMALRCRHEATAPHATSAMAPSAGQAERTARRGLSARSANPKCRRARPTTAASSSTASTSMRSTRCRNTGSAPPPRPTTSTAPARPSPRRSAMPGAAPACLSPGCTRAGECEKLATQDSQVHTHRAVHEQWQHAAAQAYESRRAKTPLLSC